MRQDRRTHGCEPLRRRGLQPGPEGAPGLRRQLRLRPQGGLHVSASCGRPGPTSTSIPGSSTTATAHLSGAATRRARAGDAGTGDRRRPDRRSLERLKQLEFEGYSFEAADGSLQLLLTRRRGGGGPTSSRSPSGPSSRSRPGRPRRRRRWRVEVDGERVVAAAEAMAPSTRSTGRCGWRSVPPIRTSQPSHLTDSRSTSSTRPPPPRRRCACSSRRRTPRRRG